MQKIEAMLEQDGLVLLPRAPSPRQRRSLARDPHLRMLAAKPAHRAYRPVPVERLCPRHVGVGGEGAVEREEAARAQDVGDLPHRAVRVLDEMDRVAEEHGVHRRRETGQVGPVPLQEADPRPGEPPLRLGECARGGLDADDRRLEAMVPQRLDQHLGDRTGAATEVDDRPASMCRPGRQTANELRHVGTVDGGVEVVPGEPLIRVDVVVAQSLHPPASSGAHQRCRPPSILPTADDVTNEVSRRSASAACVVAVVYDADPRVCSLDACLTKEPPCLTAMDGALDGRSFRFAPGSREPAVRYPRRAKGARRVRHTRRRLRRCASASSTFSRCRRATPRTTSTTCSSPSSSPASHPRRSRCGAGDWDTRPSTRPTTARASRTACSPVTWMSSSSRHTPRPARSPMRSGACTARPGPGPSSADRTRRPFRWTAYASSTSSSRSATRP